jgi:TonB family protein
MVAMLATAHGAVAQGSEAASSAQATPASAPFKMETCFRDGLQMAPSFFKRLPPGKRTVKVRIEILPPGVIGEVIVMKSSGEPDLDAAVVAAYTRVPCVTEKPVSKRLLADQTLDFNL